MPTNVTVAAFDTMTGSHAPSMNYYWWRRVALRDDPDATQFAYLYWGGMPPPAATVISATLRLTLRASHWNGHSHTVTAKRLTGAWKASKITWNNSPPVTDTNAASVTVDALGGTEVELDVTGLVSDANLANQWFGIRLELDTADTDPHHIWASDAGVPERRPELEIQWSLPPKAPTGLAPAGGRAVSDGLPTVTWAFRDREGDDQGEFQVLISDSSATDADGSFTSSEYDSGWVASGEEQHDLSGTGYAGVPDGATRFWMVRTRDVHGLTSAWSDPAEFTRAGKPTLSIDSIPDGGTVAQTTPPINTTLSAEQEAISYRLWEQQDDGTWEMVWHEWRHAAPADAGVAVSRTVPPGHIRFTDRQYSIRVLSWDTVDREETPGDPAYVRAVAEFSFTRTALPPVTSLQVADDQHVGTRLTFHRDAGVAAPDWFALVVDGKRVEDRLDPAEFGQGGDPIVYELLYYGLTSKVAHTVEVEAVVTDGGELKHSSGNATVDHTPAIGGIWLVDMGEDHQTTFPVGGPLPRRIHIRGAERPELSFGESGSTFHVVGRRDPVRITDTVRGLEGSVSGRVRQAMTADEPHHVENFRWAKTYPSLTGRRWRLSYGSENFPVELGQADWAQRSAPDGTVEYGVQVEVWQVGEFL